MIVDIPFSTAFLEQRRWRPIPETTTPGICTLSCLPSLSTTVPGKLPVLVPNSVLVPAVEISRGVSSISTLSVRFSNPGIIVSSKQWSEEPLLQVEAVCRAAVPYSPWGSP